jgi:hypothetical protein
MADDWLKRFQDFSRTVDFVDDEIFDDITGLLELSFADAWNVCFFRVLMSGHSIRTGSGDVPALSTIWSQDQSETDIQIADGGDATTITSYAYLHRKPVWVTAEDEGKLINHTLSSDDLVDQWPGPANMPALPPYSDYRGSESRTMVVLPLEYGNRMFGVINLEFQDAIPISSRARVTADVFARSLARIVWLHETNRTQVKDTQKALQRLHVGLSAAADAFKRRTIFLASSGEEAGGPVVETIKTILRDEFRDQFDLEYWAEESASGGINDQVRASIAAAEFGICYLSERHPDDPLRYIDNPNVLFEAGMFQMSHQLRDDPSDADAARWIPVRESRALSGPVPFDIAGDRVLTVPRDTETGEVDTEKLSASFREAVRELMKALNID